MSKTKEVIKTLRKMQEVSEREVYKYMADDLEIVEQQLSKAQADLELVSSLLKRTVRHLDWGCVGLLNEIEKALKQIKEKKDEQK